MEQPTSSSPRLHLTKVDSVVDTKIGQLARLHGINPMRPSPSGPPVPISEESKRRLLLALGVDVDDERANGAGFEKNEPSCSSSRCYLPEFLSPDLRPQARVWGLSLQLYELRSERNWGIGDFEDLKSIIDLAASLGGDFVGLNPLHAPFLADAARCSPYEPSNRLFLNPLYIAVDRLHEFTNDQALQEELTALRETGLVDYDSVASVKLNALRGVWSEWKSNGGLRDERLARFAREQGEYLTRHALFEALSNEMVDRGFSAGWHGWPKEYQNVLSPEVASFAETFGEDLQFHIWLQWVAHCQLGEVVEHAREAGLRIGLYLDLAVGEAVDGSATWSERDVYLREATVGSPPDPFAPNGQDWHLAGFQPSKIASGENPPFQRMVATAMRYAGAIRIDHAAALRRLFLVPVDMTPADGAYVTYPEAALLRILADTSSTFRCLVIGEDLGLLPDGLQDELAAAQILSYRILSYERDDASFKPASAYPQLALACISTHDHQTLAGWWKGLDIVARAEHGIVSAELTQQHQAERQLERCYLTKAIRSAAASPDIGSGDAAHLSQLTIDAYRFIAATPSLLAAVRLADLTDEARPTNIPGTSESYPNWRPKLSVQIEGLASLPLVIMIAKVMCDEREQTDASAQLARDEVTAQRAKIEDLGRRLRENRSDHRRRNSAKIAMLSSAVRGRPILAIGVVAVIGYLLGRR